ncbi:hypothetical protein Tco_0413609 [Tanacetum coccineum]
MGYYFYYPPENKIFVARNVEFFKDNVIVQEASGSHGPLIMSGSAKGLELIQEKYTQPSENTSEEHNEVVPMEGNVLDYIAAAEASMEAVWMRKFIDGIGDVVPMNKRPMEMLCDNEPAIAIAADPDKTRTRSPLKEHVEIVDDNDNGNDYAYNLTLSSHFSEMQANGSIIGSGESSGLKSNVQHPTKKMRTKEPPLEDGSLFS